MTKALRDGAKLLLAAVVGASVSLVLTSVRDAPTRKASGVTFEEAGRHIAAEFAGQTVDEPWAGETQKRMMESSSGKSFAGKLTLKEAECRETLCRALFVLTNPANRGDLDRLTLTEPWAAGGFVRSGPSGEIEIFVTRRGHDLPSPQAPAKD